MRDDVRTQTPGRHLAAAVTDGWLGGGAFFDTIIGGTLLGYGLDRWLGTDPWLVVTGIVLGSYAGFMRVWRYARSADGLPPSARGTGS